MTTEYLCKCNNCGNILFDENPQVNATKSEIVGTELSMVQISDGDELFWSCPNCLTDEYLTDII